MRGDREGEGGGGKGMGKERGGGDREGEGYGMVLYLVVCLLCTYPYKRVSRSDSLQFSIVAIAPVSDRYSRSLQ